MFSLFKKHQIPGLIILTLCISSSAVFSQTKKQAKPQQNTTVNSMATDHKGVVINGVCWATCNVDALGTFTARPEDAGKLYQWNRKKAWDPTGAIKGWGGGVAKGTAWTKANDPSPAGWRIPTYAEIYSLLDTKKVTTKWVTQKGVKGRKFTDRVTGKSIFIPAAGCRSYTNGMADSAGTHGYYWANNKPKGNNAYSMYFSEKYAQKTVYICNYGFFIRPVKI